MKHELAWVQISLSALKNNCAVIRSRLREGTKLGVVIKGNAYGHGAVRLLKEMEKWGTADMAIAGTLGEGREIRKAGISLPVLLLNRIPAYAVDEDALEMFIFSAYDKRFLKEINAAASKHNKMVSVHLRVDLNQGGMGILPEKFQEVWELGKKLSNVKILGIYAHPYSVYENETQLQKDMERFQNIVETLPQAERKRVLVHIANSKILFQYPQYHYDMVRAGVCLYGLPYSENMDVRIRQVFSLWGRVVSTERLKEGSRICYKEFSNTVAVKLAHIALGYWDAPFLLTGKKASCIINGNEYPLFGEPCMETCCVDITGNAQIKEGDAACFMGEWPGVDAFSVMERADLDIAHCERLCITSNRIKKIYTE